MHGARLGAVVLVAGLSSGCVPLWPHRYYEPVANEGETVRDRCWRTPERLVLRRGAVDIRVAVVRRDETRYVETSIGVPEGHRVQVGGSAVAIVDADDASRRILSRLPGVSPADTPSAHPLPIGTMLEGQRFGSTDRGTMRRYWLYAPVDVAGRQRFSVVLPPLSIDGATQDLPPIDFVRSLRWQFFAPLWC